MGVKKAGRSSGNPVKGKRDFAEAAKKIRSLDLDIIKTFKMAAESTSFHDAAKKLRTSQPRVSQRLKQLEGFLGRAMPLFDRDRRGRRLNALTPRGQELRVHAEKLLRMCDDIEDRFCDPSTVRGIVRIGVSESIVHTWLPALLKHVDAAYPQLDVEIEVDVSPKLQDLLVERKLNLAFLLRPDNAPTLRSRSLRKFPVAFVASKEISLPRGRVTLEDIVNRNLRIITFARSTKPYKVLEKRLDERGLHATIWASASLEAVVRLALEGLGIAVIPPAILLEKAEARGRLRTLNANIKLPPLDYVVSWWSASDNTVQKVIDMAIRIAREWPAVSQTDK
jgi:DNA-binding transcriptional LysR family regulator